MSSEIEKDFGPSGRKLARVALKKFYQDKTKYLNECGCDDFNLGSQPCLECLTGVVEGIVSDLLLREITTPDSKFEAPSTTRDREQFSEAAKDLISKNLKRTFNNAFSSRDQDATITNPSEAYEVGLTVGEDAAREAIKSHLGKPVSIIEEEANRLATEQTPATHSIIQEYFDQGVQESIRKFMERIPTPVTTEKLSTSRKNYRVARYEKAD